MNKKNPSLNQPRTYTPLPHVLFVYCIKAHNVFNGEELCMFDGKSSK